MEPLNEPISIRVSRLNQVFTGARVPSESSPLCYSLITREGLLDSLCVLYEECCSEHIMKLKTSVADFVRKFRPTVQELKRLRVSIDDFDVKNIIGRGHFGEVNVVREKQTGNVYAMKKLCKEELLTQKEVIFYEEERDIMAKSNSPWITQLNYAFQDAHNLYLIMEFHPGGDLLSLLDRHDGIFEEEMARFYLAEMVLAIHSLHSMGYVHRDVKPDNILIDRTGHIKLADFGSAAKLSLAKLVTAKMPVGTPDYVAPEVLTTLNSVDGKGIYGEGCDWWSVGIVAYEMLYGKTPFSDDNVAVTYSNIMNFKQNLLFPNDTEISSEAVDMMRNLLMDANKRIGYEALCKHQFFLKTDFSRMRETVPPFVPVITSQDDVSNFEEFEKEPPKLFVDDFRTQKDFSGKHLPFVGFTFTKNVQTDNSCKHLSTLAESFESPNSKAMKEKISLKNAELQKALQKINSFEMSEAALKEKVDKLTQQLREKNDALNKTEALNIALEKDMTMFINTNATLKRKLDTFMADKTWMEERASKLLQEIREKNNAAVEEARKENSMELEEWKQTVNIMEQHSDNLIKRVKKLEDQLADSQKAVKYLKKSVKESKEQSGKALGNQMSSVTDIEKKFEDLREKNQARVKELQDHINQLTRSEVLLKSEIASLKERYEELESNAAHAERKLKDVEKENADLKNKLVKMQEENKKIDELEKYEERIKSLERELRGADRRESRFCKVTQQLEDKEILVEKLTEKTAQLELKLQKVTTHQGNKAISLPQMLNAKGTLSSTNQLTDSFVKLESLEQEKKAGAGGEDDTFEQTDLMCQAKESVISIDDLDDNQQCSEYKSLEEKHSDVQQENSYLQVKIDKLEKAWTVTGEKREMVPDDANEQLKLQLEMARKEVDVLTSEVASLKQNEIVVIERHDWNKKQMLEAQREAEHYVSIIEDLSAKLQSNAERSEYSEETVKDLKHKLKTVTLKLEEIEHNLQSVQQKFYQKTEENSKLCAEIETIKSELAERKHISQSQDSHIKMLKSACSMMQSQLEEMETQHNEDEEKTSAIEQVNESLKMKISSLEHEIAEVELKVSKEQAAKEACDAKLKIFKKQMEEQVTFRSAECKAKDDLLDKYKFQLTAYEHELTELQQVNACLETDLKYAQKRLSTTEEEIIVLKNELTCTITEMNTQKASAFKLQQSLEEIIEKNSFLSQELKEQENELHAVREHHHIEKIKLEETSDQQKKLIDFLQCTVENQGKKKKGFFTKQKKDRITATRMPLMIRDLQAMLEREKETNKKLQRELEQAITKDASQHMVGHAVQPNTVLSKIDNLPNKHCENLLKCADTRQSQVEGRYVNRNIPHRFLNIVNIRAVKCAICLDTIHIGRASARCCECNTVCHPKCTSSVPSTCGLPSYHSTPDNKALKYKDQNTEATHISTENILEGWLKVLGGVKNTWSKKYCMIDDGLLKIFDKKNVSDTPRSTFNLFPTDGIATFHCAVSSGDLCNVASSDIPFVFKLEYIPDTTCWPGWNLFLMASTFEEKQTWADTLENLLVSNNIEATEKNAKLLNSLIVNLGGNEHLDVNCALQLNEKVLLLGAVEGLFAIDLDTKVLLKKIGGIECMQQAFLIDKLGIIAFLAGKQRQLCSVTMKSLFMQLDKFNAKIEPRWVESISQCHLVACHYAAGAGYACASLSDKVRLLKWNTSSLMFEVVKEFCTREPCSCLLFTEHSLLLGADKFMEIDLKLYTIEDFLDSSDTSLAYVIYGTVQRNCFPVAIIQVAPSSQEEEYLLCFHEFGVFVDPYGSRSRKEDIKWTKLPLAFAFSEPYLFVAHFNCIEVRDIQKHQGSVRRTILPISNPRYLGLSLSNGKIYIASVQTKNVSVLRLRGNLAVHGAFGQSEISPVKRKGSQSTLYCDSSTDEGLNNGEATLELESSLSDSVSTFSYLRQSSMTNMTLIEMSPLAQKTVQFVESSDSS